MTRSFFSLLCLIAALMSASYTTPASAQAAGATAAAPAGDAAIAAELKGNWTGTWTLPGFGGGKFELIVTEVNGANVVGSANWYGTAAGDTKAPLTKAVVQNGTLAAEQPTITFKLSPKGDTLTGTWYASGYDGPLSAKR